MPLNVNQDVIREVTRASKRNNGKDVENLPDSEGKVLDRAGVQATGYLKKKGTPAGIDAFFNVLPPGMNIDDQEVADIRELPMRNYDGGLGYPKDGWD